MTDVELILVLLAIAVVLAVTAARIRMPYPIVLVLGGIALAFTPVPRFEIAPDTALVVFLPPLLFSAAWLMSWREFRTHARTIGLLAIGLVLATTAGVAVVAHAIVPGLPWSVAFVLGAIVSPPDAVAATSVMQRVHVPRRLVVILEGESLINDATGLVAYQVALAAVAGASFSAPHIAAQFGAVGLGGILFGLGIGWLVARAHRRLDDFTIETAITVLTPYIAFIPAEHFGFSGVLAAVSAGGYLGWHGPHLFSPATRLRSRGVWTALLFVLESLVFVLVGLELAGSHRLVGAQPVGRLVLWCAVVAGATIAIRLVWVPVVRSGRTWKESLVISWCGMRGIISLALALALPEDFPFRDLVVLIVFVVIAVTLIGQGLTLPFVIRAAGLADDEPADDQLRDALHRANEAALARLDEVAAALESPPDVVDRVRALYARRAERVLATEAPDAIRRLRARLIEIERDTIVELRDRGEISEEILERLLNDLDLESLQSSPPA